MRTSTGAGHGLTGVPHLLLPELEVLLLGICQPQVNSGEPLVGFHVGQDTVEVGAVLFVFEVGPAGRKGRRTPRSDNRSA
jgi:hypothetical protein